MEMVGRLRAENGRLKRVELTEEEFQNLCRNFSDRFNAGCREYEKKLFGCED